MQVRYADTPAQKELKRITAERRQYRTNEYNIGAYGTVAVGINPSIYNTQPAWARTPRVSRSVALANIVSCLSALLKANLPSVSIPVLPTVPFLLPRTEMPT